MKTTSSFTWSSDEFRAGADGLTVVGQLGQSLDGQIATATGHSKYINGPAGLRHLHELRAWADVVVVGVGTVIADNPKLTVRLVSGASPDRVVIDPSGRVPMDALCLQDDGVRRVVVTGPGCAPLTGPAGLAQARFDLTNQGNQIDADQIRSWLRQQGWRRVLVEGGALTLSRFLEQGTLDCLHLIVSPVLLGPGVAGVRTEPVAQLSKVARFKVASYGLGDDLLITCSFG